MPEYKKKANKYHIEDPESEPSDRQEEPSSDAAASSVNEEEQHFAQIQKESEPMRITNLMLMHPCKVLCFSYLILIIFSAITLGLGYMMPSLEGTRNRDFAIFQHPYQVDADKLALA